MADSIYNGQLDAFGLYHQRHEHSQSSILGGPALPALGHAVSGATGTAISNVLIYPLDLVITRLQVQNQPNKTKLSEEPDYNGILDAAQKIYEREGGISAFYSGCLYDTGKSIADSFLFFLAYNFIRNSRLKAHKDAKSLPIPEELLVGMLAGAFGKFFTTPVQQIVTRKQTAAPGAKASTAEIISEIQEEKGIQGFWSGYSATLILTLNPSLTFLFHGLFSKLLVPKSKQKEPGPLLTFALAAASKSLASTITYPFSLAKTRAQVSSKSTEKSVEFEDDAKGKGNVANKLNSAAMRQLTIFTSILNVAREEGVLALYQGVGGEVLKGFFSHGLTMLLKERIHVTIIKLYYLVLKALKIYPSPEELAQKAKEQGEAVLAKGKELAVEAAKQGNSTIAQAAESTQEAFEKGKEFAVEAAKQGNSTIAQAAESTREAFEKGQHEAGKYYEDGVESTKTFLWGIVDDDDE